MIGTIDVEERSSGSGGVLGDCPNDFRNMVSSSEQSVASDHSASLSHPQHLVLLSVNVRTSQKFSSSPAFC